MQEMRVLFPEKGGYTVIRSLSGLPSLGLPYRTMDDGGVSSTGTVHVYLSTRFVSPLSRQGYTEKVTLYSF